MAALLRQCCVLTYEQLQGTDITSQLPQGYIISFCAQTGTVGGNHSCADTYAPYVQALTNNFSAAQAQSA